VRIAQEVRRLTNLTGPSELDVLSKHLWTVENPYPSSGILTGFPFDGGLQNQAPVPVTGRRAKRENGGLGGSPRRYDDCGIENQVKRMQVISSNCLLP
jgi:hypothetical protein